MDLLTLLILVVLVVVLWPFVKAYAFIILVIAAIIWLLGNGSRRL